MQIKQSVIRREILTPAPEAEAAEELSKAGGEKLRR
jgi:hypothetical protein